MMQRGEIYLVNLDPVVGSEVGKTRPALVLQNEMANRTSPTVTVVPISSSVSRIYPFQVRLLASETGLDRDSKALCEQIRSIARQRLLHRLGQVSEGTLANIRVALDRHLWF